MGGVDVSAQFCYKVKPCKQTSTLSFQLQLLYQQTMGAILVSKLDSE